MVYLAAFVLLQIPPEEMFADAEHLFSIVMCDAEFEGVMKNLDHHQATDAVYEAVKMLQTAPPKPDDEAECLDLSPKVCKCVVLGYEHVCTSSIYAFVGLSGSDAISTMASLSSH